MESEDTEELAKFRQQWRDELQQRSTDDAERTAREFFLKGVAFERRGNHYEALHFYRQAIHLVPDIESRVSQDENCAFSGTLQMPPSISGYPRF
ncbi:F-box only protein 9-like [Corticium candelabrum]|uniref:F-box only protein 9-like n=1 Tax=Corticium candelabrum TaxID=121492 RepID=UPI002E275B9D|nr:F-box only protein 9-like [Corticium candelabrum]